MTGDSPVFRRAIFIPNNVVKDSVTTGVDRAPLRTPLEFEAPPTVARNEQL